MNELWATNNDHIGVTITNLLWYIAIGVREGKIIWGGGCCWRGCDIFLAFSTIILHVSSF